MSLTYSMFASAIFVVVSIHCYAQIINQSISERQFVYFIIEAKQ